MQIEQRVAELVAEKIADRPELFLVDVKMLQNKNLIIQVDGDEGINIADCAAISRHVGFHLEEENALEAAYNLEVSSPGVGEPLKLSRQYYKNIGRTLGIKLISGTLKEGKLMAVNDQSIVLEERISPAGKAKGTKMQLTETSIDFKDISETKVLISFK